MNRNLVVFVLLSVLVLFGSQALMDRFFPAARISSGRAAHAQPVSGTAAVSVASPVKVVPAAKPASAASPILEKAPETLVRFETGSYVVALSSWGARFTSLKLKGVVEKTKTGLQDLDLVPAEDAPQFGVLQMPGTDLERLQWKVLTPQPLTEDGRLVVRFATKVPGTPVQLVKTFSFDPSAPRFSLQVKVSNPGAQQLSLAPLALLWGPNLGGDSAGIGLVVPSVVVQLDGKIEREKAGKDQQVLGYAAPRWLAVKNHYFVTGLFPRQGFNKAEVRKLGGGKISGALVADGLSLAPGQSVELDADAYAGPQEYGALKAIGGNFQRVVQFQSWSFMEAILNPVCVGMLYILKWFHAISGNWGIAIIVLTLLVRAVMFWPSLKSMVAMRRMQTKMAVMKPRLETLKKIYKDDAQKLNAETMKLYQEHGVNPLGGCLPMLLQIPIFFALYGTLGAAYELRGASFFWKWDDLTAGDPTYIFPIAMGISMFLQQKLAPSTASTMSDDQAQMQKMMLWLMPIMFTVMALTMHWPVGLLLYWTASNLFGIGQQLAVNKAVD